MRASYFNPETELTVRIEDCPTDAVADLVNAILGLDAGSGHPTLELVRSDGRILSLSTNGSLALLVYVDSLGASFHSVGQDSNGDPLIFDYFGSWSEAPSEWLVPLAHAEESLRRFAGDGYPETDMVIFEPD